MSPLAISDASGASAHRRVRTTTSTSTASSLVHDGSGIGVATLDNSDADDGAGGSVEVDGVALFAFLVDVEVVRERGVLFTSADVVELVGDGAPAVWAGATFVHGLVEAGLGLGPGEAVRQY